MDDTWCTEIEEALSKSGKTFGWVSFLDGSLKLLMGQTTSLIRLNDTMYWVPRAYIAMLSSKLQEIGLQLLGAALMSGGILLKGFAKKHHEILMAMLDLLDSIGNSAYEVFKQIEGFCYAKLLEANDSWDNSDLLKALETGLMTKTDSTRGPCRLFCEKLLSILKNCTNHDWGENSRLPLSSSGTR